MPFVVALPAAVIAILGAALTLLGARPGVLTGFAFGFGATLLMVTAARRPYGRISAPGWPQTILTGIVCVTSLFLLSRPLFGVWAAVVAASGGLACAAADRRIGARQAARSLHRALVVVTILAVVGAVVPQLVAASALIAGAGASMLLPADLMTRARRQVLKAVVEGRGALGGSGSLRGGALRDGALRDDGALREGALGDGALRDGALRDDGALREGALGDGGVLGGAPRGRGLWGLGLRGGALRGEGEGGGRWIGDGASDGFEGSHGGEISGDVQTSPGREALPGDEVSPGNQPSLGQQAMPGRGISYGQQGLQGGEGSADRGGLQGGEASADRAGLRGGEGSAGRAGLRGYETEALALAAFLDPMDIPKSLLEAAAARSGAGRASSLRTLVPGALTEIAHDSLQIQPLVQEFARRRLLPGERRTWAGRAVRMLAEAFPQEPSVLGNRLVPHASAAAGHAETLGVERAAVLLLLNQVAAFLAVSGRPEEAQVWRERAIARASKDFAGSSVEAAELLVASDPKTPKVRKKKTQPAKPSKSAKKSAMKSAKKEEDAERLAAEPPTREGSSSDPPTLAFPAVGGALPHGSAVYRSSGYESGGDGPVSGGPISAARELGMPESSDTSGLDRRAGLGSASATPDSGLVWSEELASGGESGAATSYLDSSAAGAVGPPSVPVGSFERLLAGTDRAAFAFHLAELGDARRDAGDLAGARRDYRLALRRARRVLPRKHPLREHLRAQLAALPSPRSQESNERRLALGCFTLVVASVLICVGAAMLRGMDGAGITPSDDQLTNVDQLVEVCHANQRYFPGAAPFAGAEPHPALVFRRTVNDGSFVRDPFGGNNDPSRIQLVACAAQVETGPPVAVCKFPGQKDIPLHGASYQVTVYETWTGRRLGQQVVSAGVGTCPTSFAPPPQDKPWMLYAAPTDDQYRQVIQPVFDLLPAVPASRAASAAG